MLSNQRKKFLKSLAEEMEAVITAGWCREEDIIEYVNVNRSVLTEEENIYLAKKIKV